MVWNGHAARMMFMSPSRVPRPSIAVSRVPRPSSSSAATTSPVPRPFHVAHPPA